MELTKGNSLIKKTFKVGDAVRYVPRHVNGDSGHPLCELGYITSMKGEAIFVNYGGGTSHSTRREDLFHYEKK